MALITAEARAELTALFVSMLNAAPGADNLSELVTAMENGASLLDVANTIAASSDFSTVYPAFLTVEEFTDRIVSNMLGAEVGAQQTAWATDWVSTALQAGATRAEIFVTAVKALRTNINPAYDNAEVALNNKVDVALYYSVTKQQSDSDLADLQAVLSGVTSAASTVTTAKTTIDLGAAVAIGKTFTLSSGVDTVAGTAGNDSIVASGTAANETLTAFDTIDGGAGDDSMAIVSLVAAGITIPASASVKNIESVSISGVAGVTAALDAWTGLQTVVVGAATGAVAITTKGNATSVTTGGTGTTTVAITDNATTDTLTTVSIADNAGAATVTSGALTTLSLANTAQNATVTAGAAARTINLNGVTGGTITDAAATGVTVNGTGTASSAVTLTAAAATGVTVDADVAVTLADVNVAAATKITVKGDSKVTLSAATTVTALTAIDASASTGGADFDAFVLGNGVAFSGGSGADAVQLAASTKATTMGAGDDMVTLTGAALGAAGSADGGEGTDTLSMTAANAATATGSATFEGTIAGFERLTLTAPTTDTINLSNLDDISYVTTGGATALTLNNIASGGTLVLNAASTAATISVLNAALNTADTFNLKVTNAAATAAGTVTIANVESIALNTDDSAATPTSIQHTMTLTAANATSLTVTGDAGVALTLTGSTALSSINTSGVTKGAVSLTTVADVATTFVGGATATTVSLAGITTATKAGSITTGAGNDNITGGAGNDTINAGDGTNSINGGGGNDTIVGGAGVDTITGGNGADKITGGAGADIFTYTAAVESSGVNQDTITDFVAGTDKLAIDVTGAGTYLGEANGYGAVLTALAGGGNGAAVLDISTSTLYVDVNGDAQLNTSDMAIQLTGIVDLSSTDFTFS